MGCDANEQFVISNAEAKGAELFMADEDTPCLIRFCCGGNRPMTINITQNKQLMLRLHRPLRCPMASMKCNCCLQEMTVADATGKHLGTVQEDGCWVCVPRMQVIRPDRSVEFTLQQPTCCGGTCVHCCSEGCCRVPVNVFEGSNTLSTPVGKITKVWAGLGAEMLGLNSVEVTMPSQSLPVTRARLLAATFFLTSTLFAPEDSDDVVDL
jgi:hypothetical protein